MDPRASGAIVRLEDENAVLRVQVIDLQKKLVGALCRCGPSTEISVSLHTASCEYWKAMEKSNPSTELSTDLVTKAVATDKRNDACTCNWIPHLYDCPAIRNK